MEIIIPNFFTVLHYYNYLADINNIEIRYEQYWWKSSTSDFIFVYTITAPKNPDIHDTNSM